MDAKILAGKPLTEIQILRMVEAYRKRMLTYRAETTAKIIVGNLTSVAIEQASKKAVEAIGLFDSDLIKEWRSMRDKRVRRTHNHSVGMDGQKVPFNSTFLSPSGARLRHPHDSSAPLSEIAGCRCRMLVYIDPAKRI